MLQRRTVLILGAGSSVEFGMPDGARLAERIAQAVDFYANGVDLVSGDADLYRTALNMLGPSTAVFKAGRRIASGLPLSHSIDDFLFNHGEDAAMVALGKLAIAANILRAERHSRLHDVAADYKPRDGFNGLNDTWLFRLFRFLQTDVRRGEIEKVFENLAIINFNYDRCVEQFFGIALERAYGASPEEIKHALQHLEIRHPYGQVGLLPWQEGSGERVTFGEELNGERLIQISSQIRTYTEQAHSPRDLAGWRQLIAEAERVVFLGFAFHPQNIELLQTHPEQVVSVYGTILHASAPDAVVFRDRIGLMLEGVWEYPPKLLDGKAAEFIAQYGRELVG